jgi:hypothetical protein
MDQIVGFATACRHESGSRASGIGLRAVRIYWQRRGRLRASDCDREHLFPIPNRRPPPRVYYAPRAALANWRGRRPGSKGLKILPRPFDPIESNTMRTAPGHLISHPAPEKLPLDHFPLLLRLAGL